MHFRRLKFPALIFFPCGPAILGNLGCGLNNNGRWKCDSFSSPHPHHPRKKKLHNLEWGWGLSSLSHWGKSKAGHVGFFKCFLFNKSSYLLLFYLCGKMKNDFFCFYSSRASSQFVNLMKYTVVPIRGMVREKGKKMTLFNIDLVRGKLKHWFFFLSGLLAFWKCTLSLCILLYRIRSYLLKKMLIFERN